MSDWRQVSLSEVVTRVTTKNVGGTNENVLTVSAAHGLIAQESFFTKKVASLDTSGYYLVAPGQFVYNKSTSKSAAFGMVARNLRSEPGVVSPLYFVFEVNEGAALPEYLELALNSDQFFGSLAGTLREGARSHGLLNVRLKEFYSATVILPPAPVQERIVEVIAAVDDQIAALGAEADVLDKLWWALGRDMAAAVADEKRVPLASFCDISGGLTKNKKDQEQPDLVEVPYLRVANVYRRRLNLADVATIQTTRAKAEKLRLLPGDILMNEGGDRDKLGRGHVWEGQIPDCIHQNHVFRVRVIENRFDPYFVSAWGNTFGQQWFETSGTQTTGIASINRTTLSRFPVPDVPLSVQQDWARRLGTVVETMDSLRIQADCLRAARASMMSGLLDRSVEIESIELEG